MKHEAGRFSESRSIQGRRFGNSSMVKPLRGGKPIAMGKAHRKTHAAYSISPVGAVHIPVENKNKCVLNIYAAYKLIKSEV